ncbi:heterogeneous nuclear ribonucleoprotein U-like protein [Musa troglodytarum]|uniref:Heterogeneous nuclear ribonucleoprotein U-like protein n=1 Tax=Musa troglodytarum TaxID=320322 RepID=A0A9E7E9P7_9LILI|nr:heterogeneous nuclear ribonucleoprotein U-like protein [Musa troglodytarum]
MASKHHLPSTEPDQGPAAKRSRPEPPSGPLQPGANPVRVELNPADCDLDFDINGNGLRGQALTEEGFAYCWSGARANVGIIGGKYCFGCKIISDQTVDMADTPPDQQHVCRVGISWAADPVGNLGETTNSFGFGGTGKFSSSGKFSDYGIKFGVYDTIVCAVDLDNKPLASIGFSKNGKWLGVASHFDASSRGLGVVELSHQGLPWESALFPHVLLKNVVVQLQFSIEDGLVPEEGYKPWASALQDANAVLGPTFTSPSQCEVIMMVGLPASGKTTWAEKWIKEHPEKRYVLLGTNLALDQMKVPGLLRKRNYGERFDCLMDRATKIFNTLLTRASKKPRNYILDQTNVYRSARNRKLKTFVNYRKIAVVVFPTPDELRFRAKKRFKEMGKDVPAEAVTEMIVNYVLPLTKNMHGSNELFDEVIFPEIGREEAQRHLDEMKRMRQSPNLSAKRDLPPFAHEHSIRSFPVPNVATVEASPGAIVNLSASHPCLSVPCRDSSSTFQDSTTYSSRGSSGDHRILLGDTGLPMHRDSAYTDYSKYGVTSCHGSDPGPYRSYTGSNFSTRNAYDRSSIPYGDMSVYQTYNTANAFRRPSFDSLSSSGKVINYENPLAPTLYRSQVGQLLDPGFPHIHHPAARGPSYEWRSPTQSTHGLNYGAPPPRPPYGDPSNQINPRPGQWYH